MARVGLAAMAAALWLPVAACGSASGTATPATTSESAASTSAAATTAAAAVEAACPLIDKALIESNFDVQSLELSENEPAKTGPATTYACDLSDAGELFLTAGVSIGPRSGTAAGVKQAGDQWMVVFVHGAPGNKEQLVAVAQDLAQKV